MLNTTFPVHTHTHIELKRKHVHEWFIHESNSGHMRAHIHYTSDSDKLSVDQSATVCIQADENNYRYELSMESH